MLWKKPRKIHAESSALIQASKDGPATFEARPAYSGGILKTSSYRFGVILDLAGLTVNPKVVANLDHDSKKRVGHITDHTNDGKSLSLSGVMSADTDHTREVLASHERGFQWDVSIEAIPTVKPEMVEAGKTVFVNGQSFQGPVEVARKSTLYGLGFVSLGADSENHVAIAAEEMPPLEEEELIDEQTFESWAMSHEFDLESMSESELAMLQSIYEKQSKASEPIAASFDASFIRSESQKTASKIEAALLRYEDSLPAEKLAEIRAEAHAKLRALKARAGEHEFSGIKYRFESTPIIAETHLALIRAERPQGPSIISSSKDNVMNSEVIEAKLVYRIAGEKGALRFFDERTVEAARKSGIDSFPDICKVANHQNGNVTHDGTQATVINAMRPVYASSGPTNINVPTILNNVANKVMLFGYEEYPSAIFDLAEVKSVRDFKDNTDIRMSAGENLVQLAPGGEIKHGKLDEENVFTRKVDTYAQMRMIDRRDLVNDDLRAFDQLQKIDGAAAKRTLINLFWQVWMTGAGSFWHANNNNLLTTGTALSIANLGKGVSAMRKQTDSKGNVLDMQPTYLIVPPELESTAKPIVNSAQIIGAGSESPDGNPMFNIVKGVITEPRLSNAGYTNNSLTAWYLSAQKQAGAIVISFLEGKDSPTVETELADFNRLGLQMRVFFDFGVSLGDPKAAFKATGAS